MQSAKIFIQQQVRRPDLAYYVMVGVLSPDCVLHVQTGCHTYHMQVIGNSMTFMFQVTSSSQAVKYMQTHSKDLGEISLLKIQCRCLTEWKQNQARPRSLHVHEQAITS